MREQWAKRIVFITVLLVLLLAFLFAALQNPTEKTHLIENTDHLAAIHLEAEQIEAGRQVYRQHNCARCHSIAGEGNPRNPLDTIGDRRSAEEIRDYIIGASHLKKILAERNLQQKQRYRSLPADELDALVIYMRSLRS